MKNKLLKIILDRKITYISILTISIACISILFEVKSILAQKKIEQIFEQQHIKEKAIYHLSVENMRSQSINLSDQSAKDYFLTLINPIQIKDDQLDQIGIINIPEIDIYIFSLQVAHEYEVLKKLIHLIMNVKGLHIQEFEMKTVNQYQIKPTVQLKLIFHYFIKKQNA